MLQAGCKPAHFGVMVDTFGVLWEHFGVVLDMFNVSVDKLGGINGHKNIVFEIKTLFLRIFYGIIMALEYSTKTEYN
ncbi:MAG: hypothetical protein ACYTEU_10635 [Planctomycetota bacterium]